MYNYSQNLIVHLSIHQRFYDGILSWVRAFLQELFRWIVDYSIIQILEDTPRLKKSDFILTENYDIRLRERTAKLLIEKIRLNFNSKVPYKGKNCSFSNILHENILRLANYITDKTEKLRFDVPKFEIERNDAAIL